MNLFHLSQQFKSDQWQMIKFCFVERSTVTNLGIDSYLSTDFSMKHLQNDYCQIMLNSVHFAISCKKYHPLRNCFPRNSYLVVNIYRLNYYYTFLVSGKSDILNNEILACKLVCNESGINNFHSLGIIKWRIWRMDSWLLLILKLYSLECKLWAKVSVNLIQVKILNNYNYWQTHLLCHWSFVSKQFYQLSYMNLTYYLYNL